MNLKEFHPRLMKVIIIVLSAIFLASLGCLIFFLIREKFLKKQLKEKSNSLRILIIDRKNNKVKFFDKTSIGVVKERTFEEYLKTFPKNDANKFINWIDSLLENSNQVDPHLEIEVILKSKNKIKNYSILEVKKIDKEKQIIHIESYLFKFVAEKDYKLLKKSSISKTEISQMFDKSTNLHGYTTVFKFATMNDKVIEEKIDRLVLLQLKEIIVKYINTPARYLLELSQNELAIFDMRIISSGSMIALTKHIYQEMCTYLSISGLSYKIRIGGGVIDNRLCTYGFDKHIQKAEETATIALEQNESYILYRKNLELQIGDKEIFKSEILEIIKENKLTFFYEPICQINKNKVFGYLTSIKPINTFFANYEDTLEYARKTDDLNSLLSFTFKKLIGKFEEECNDPENSKIFIDVKMVDAKAILSYFNSKEEKLKTNIGLIFKEKEIDYYLKNEYEEMVRCLNEFKSKNFDVAMRLKDKEIIFSESVYSLFTSFFADFSEFKEDKSTTPFRLKLRSIGEKLIKSDKPIIMSEINSWRNIETVIKSGFTLITSKMISTPEEKPLPIASRYIKKIKEIKK